jgi:peptidoglycan/xylan/chitin deacetylase (PgdA/CDA1 family)
MKNTATLLTFALFLSLLSPSTFAAEISITMDDPEVSESPIFSPIERNRKILDAFEHSKIKAALFVCGMRIDNPQGRALLQSWDKDGHLIASHSYSHLYFNSQKMSFETYRDDFLKVEPLLIGLKNFSKLYRFPYLKEGNTVEKRDRMRTTLKEHGYSQGYVTIDASDWYIDLRLRERLKVEPKADLKPYRDFYLKHMWDRSVFYTDLAKKVYGREIKHTVLIHHNLLNALFLKDLIEMYRDNGWKIISAKDAYKDPVFQLEPNISPAGESVVWASAKESGKFENILRYPGEDGEYEKVEMDRLGL